MTIFTQQQHSQNSSFVPSLAAGPAPHQTAQQKGGAAMFSPS